MGQRIRLGLSGNALKIIAMIAMFMDHMGSQLFPSVLWLRAIGRVAFPIFAYMIAEGYTYTRNRLRYWLTIAGLGIICQIAATIATRTLHQGILITFSLAIGLMFLSEVLFNSQRLLHRLLAFFGIAVIAFFTLSAYLFPPFWIDYGAFGIILPTLVYYVNGHKRKVFTMALGVAAHALTAPANQWFALCAIPLLFLYNGTRGKAKIKYLFYIFYPAHLIFIWLLATLF